MNLKKVLFMMLFIGIIVSSLAIIRAEGAEKGTSQAVEEGVFEEVPEETAAETPQAESPQRAVEEEAEGAFEETAEEDYWETSEEEIAEEAPAEMPKEVEEEAAVSTFEETPSGNVTIDFKDADIRNVLRILSYKGGVNIVAGKGVEGPVTIRLTDVPWDQALDVLLKTYDYGYERKGNIITVIPLEELTKKKIAEKELAEVEPLITEVFTLKYLDANDAKKVLEPQLSGRGKITVLEVRGMKGWKFVGIGAEGGAGVGTQERYKEEEKGQARAKVLVISDITSYMEKIKNVVEKIDVMPRQILIEARIMEVDKDLLEDIGFDWATGSGGAETKNITGVPISKHKGTDVARVGGHVLGSEVTPSPFDPKSTGILGYEPYNVGLEFVLQKLTGTQFEVIIHALEEDVRTNTLSAPRIMTLENQEANILVGTKYPIIKQEATTTETGATTVTGGSLERYENVGIQLLVVPQISGEEYINMIVHPMVSSIAGWEYITGTTSGTRYPKVDTREAETQVLIKDGETVVIGGLLKDIKSKGRISVPILGDIPILGLLFQRETTDTAKVDLLIFITARIVKPEMGKQFVYGRQEGKVTMEEFGKRTPDREKFTLPFKQKTVEKPKEAGVVEVPSKE